MDTLLRLLCESYADAGLLWLRLSGSALLFHVHGWPKLVHYREELAHIEDPFGFGAPISLMTAIFAEVICPLWIAAGLFTRLACLPIIGLLAVAMLVVHREWSIAEGQFGWLLMIIFIAIALCGPGRWSLEARLGMRNDSSAELPAH